MTQRAHEQTSIEEFLDQRRHDHDENAHHEHVEGTVDPVDQAVSDGIQQAWIDFATTGSPGWEPYALADGGGVMVIDDTFESVDTIRDGRCEAQL